MNSSNKSNHEQQLQVWAQIIADCKEAKASGTNTKDWLKSHNISHDTYYYWYRRVKESYRDKSLPEIASIPASIICPNTSVPIVKDKSIQDMNQSSIKLSVNDVAIEISCLADPMLLVNVIKAVRYAQ